MLIHIESLSKRFAARLAADAISLSIAKGEVVALLGPNGAGKTTLMRLMAGVIEPDAGACLIDGRDMTLDRIAAQSRIGYLPEGAPLYQDSTPRAHIRFAARMQGLAGQAMHAAVAQVARDIAIEAVLNRPIGHLSKGFRRRVALAAALVHRPPVLILDEPTDGLDPHQCAHIHALLARLRPEHAIVLSTHRLEDVSAIATRVLILHRGVIVADATPPALCEAHGDLSAAFKTLTREEESA